MKIKLVFWDWMKFDDGQFKSVYGKEYELSLGDFHSGATFDAEIKLDSGNEKELEEAIKNHYMPCFYIVQDKPTSGEKCSLCGKKFGEHKAGTHNCPFGNKTRIGYTNYHSDQMFKSEEN